MPQGTVKEYHLDEHHGVVLLDDRTEIYFDEHSLHDSHLRYLRLGQRVKFDIVEEHGRKMARHLRHITID
jgi:cold shock CspA family protein